MDVKSLFKEDSFYLIVGIKRRGKSTLTKYLLYYQIMAGLIDWVWYSAAPPRSATSGSS